MFLLFNKIQILKQIGMLLICGLLLLQPIVEICIQVEEKMSIVDVDEEIDFEENMNKELEKEKTLWNVFQIDFSNDRLTSSNSSFFHQDFWASLSQEIVIPPPDYLT